MNRTLANRSAEAVFLCYHSIAERGEPYLALPPELFERQLALLRRRGYRSGGIADLERLARGERPSQRTVFLTFDDGFRDNFLVAQPLMREYGFCPIIFLIPPLVENGAGFEWPELVDAHAENPDILRSLTWREVEQMAEQGAEFGSHTLSHPHLAKLDDEDLAEELLESRRAIEARLETCAMLAYPYGEWDHRVARAAGSAGYRYAFSLPQGPQREADRLCIPRVNVDYRDGERRFGLKLRSSGRRLLLSGGGERLRKLRPRGRRGSA